MEWSMVSVSFSSKVACSFALPPQLSVISYFYERLSITTGLICVLLLQQQNLYLSCVLWYFEPRMIPSIDMPGHLSLFYNIYAALKGAWGLCWISFVLGFFILFFFNNYCGKFTCGHLTGLQNWFLCQIWILMCLLVQTLSRKIRSFTE